MTLKHWPLVILNHGDVLLGHRNQTWCFPKCGQASISQTQVENVWDWGVRWQGLQRQTYWKTGLTLLTWLQCPQFWFDFMPLANTACLYKGLLKRCWGLKPGPPTCKTGALPLSYIPFLDLWNMKTNTQKPYSKHEVELWEVDFCFLVNQTNGLPLGYLKFFITVTSSFGNVKWENKL